VKWLKHAFAVDKPTTLEVNDQQRVLVDRICAEVIRRRMATPALLLLEMHRPFNYVSAQVMHFFQPMLSILTDTAGYDQFVLFLEQRGSIDYLISRIDAMELAAAGEGDRHGADGEPTTRESETPSVRNLESDDQD
jgi:hypothetical protein